MNSRLVGFYQANGFLFTPVNNSNRQFYTSRGKWDKRGHVEAGKVNIKVERYCADSPAHFTLRCEVDIIATVSCSVSTISRAYYYDNWPGLESYLCVFKDTATILSSCVPFITSLLLH